MTTTTEEPITRHAILMQLVELEAVIDGLSLIAEDAEGDGAKAMKARGALRAILDDAAERVRALVEGVEPSGRPVTD